MLIESIIHRRNGTKITLDDTTYHFVEDEHGRHVAEVADENHISKLLGIREGFRLANAADSASIGFVDTTDMDGAFFVVRGPQDMLAFRQWLLSIPDMADIDNVAEPVLLIDKIAIGEANLDGHSIVELPPSLGFSQASDTPAPEPSPPAPVSNTILPIDQTQQPAAVSDTGDAQSAGEGGAGVAGGAGAETAEADEPLDREALAKEYDELVGHRPNGKWTAEKIAEKIAELKAQG